MSQEKDGFVKDMTTIMGHPSGLFTLFFTEMWERFSYYGMRALLTMFLISEIAIGGWEWSTAEAGKLYGIYTGLVYVTPIIGGLIADKFLGSRKTVVIGALLMTLGHASLAFETEFFFYLGLALLILGNGAFKPNISSIVGGLYKDNPEKKDAAYTIFYMGINAGAFMGILFCGYLGEKVGWSYGFGLAGVFMFLGMIQFYFGQNILGKIGLSPKQQALQNIVEDDDTDENDVEVDTTPRVIKWAVISAALAAALYFLVPMVLPDIAGEWVGPVIVGCMVGVIGYILTDPNLRGVAKDRVTVVVILAIFTIFFWWAFEQAGSSMTVFAKDFTNRVLTGSASTWFFWINFLLTVVPLVIITIVLLLLFKNTIKTYPISVGALTISFVMIWGIAVWMLNNEFNMKAYEVAYSAEVENEETGKLELVEYNPTIRSPKDLAAGDNLSLLQLKGKYIVVSNEKAQELKNDITATVVRAKGNETEVPASWFGILNSFFIIAFAPLFSRLWQTKLNPSAPVKFALGLVLLGLGFAILSFGAMAIPNGAETAKISMFFLVFAYLFHTLGELTLSPVGLSYVSKLTPAKLMGIIFGIWFGATAVANYLGGMTASFIEPISHKVGLSGFFLIFTIIPVLAGVVLIMMNGYLKKKMHGIE